MTVTRADIEQQVIAPAIGTDWDNVETIIESVTDAVLDAAPLHTWYLKGTTYTCDGLDADDFWAIIEKVTTTA